MPVKSHGEHIRRRMYMRARGENDSLFDVPHTPPVYAHTHTHTCIIIILVQVNNWLSECILLENPNERHVRGINAVSDDGYCVP